MNSITLSKKQFDNLTRLDIGSSQSTESNIFILDKGPWKYADGSMLLKELHTQDGVSMSTKLATVSLLSDKKDEININELVIPNNLVVVKNKVIGFTVPYIKDAKSLKSVIENPKIDNKEKIEYLRQVGKTLKKDESLERRKVIILSIGDLHEDNVLVTKDKNIKFVDLDGAYIGNNYPQDALYLYSKAIKNVKKYKFSEYGQARPDKNTDLYCYNMMLLNMISRRRLYICDISEYFDYLNYLKKLGFGADILKSFGRVYTEGPNINPVDYLDEIPEDKLGEAGYKIYEFKKNNHRL